MIRHETIEGYLHRLASGEPTPGGGATGALQLAQGAGLLAMSARFSGHEDLAERCTSLATTALELSDADESGFAAVADAYGMPDETEDERGERSARIQQAMQEAAEPPQRTVHTAEDLLEAARSVLDDCNPNVRSDVGAALGALRAGVVAAVVTLETNLMPLKDGEARQALRGDIDAAEDLTTRADELIEHTRRLIRGE